MAVYTLTYKSKCAGDHYTFILKKDGAPLKDIVFHKTMFQSLLSNPSDEEIFGMILGHVLTQPHATMTQIKTAIESAAWTI